MRDSPALSDRPSANSSARLAAAAPRQWPAAASARASSPGVDQPPREGVVGGDHCGGVRRGASQIDKGATGGGRPNAVNGDDITRIQTAGMHNSSRTDSTPAPSSPGEVDVVEPDIPQRQMQQRGRRQVAHRQVRGSLRQRQRAKTVLLFTVECGHGLCRAVGAAVNRLPLVPPQRSADFVGGGTGGQQLGTVHDGWQGELFRHALMLTGSQAGAPFRTRNVDTSPGVDNCEGPTEQPQAKTSARVSTMWRYITTSRAVAQ